MAKRTIDVKTKSENKQAIYRFIQEHETATKQDIYAGLGLSLPTIKQGLEFLEQEHLITTAGKIENTGGRNALAYCLSTDTYFSIGVFISLHHLSAVCVDLSGNVIHSIRSYFPLDLQSDTYLRTIGNLVEDVKNAVHIDDSRLLGVGIAVPSLVSEDGESVIFGMTSDFTGITREVLATYIPYPVKMYHDSDVAGFAEVKKNPNIKNAIYLNMNNSLGSSIILDGKLYSGNNRLSGELGHIIVEPHNGKKCYCGQTGCFDTVCNACVLDSYTNGKLEQFFQKLDEHDAKAMQIWDTYLDHLALAIHNIRMLLDCTIIIGGYVGTYIEKYMGDLYQKIDKLSVFTKFSRTYVLPCSYKKEATAAGAGIQIIENFINSL